MNLRERAEQDLGRTLEGEFGLPVVLIEGATGNIQRLKKGTTEPLVGQIAYDQVKQAPGSVSGETVVVFKPVVTLRRSSLDVIPGPKEKWIVQIPISPVAGAPIENYTLDETRPPEGGNSLGIIRLYVVKVIQS